MESNLFLLPGHTVVGRLQQWPLPPHANAGLVWDRYLQVWGGTVDNPQRLSPLLRPLTDFAHAFNQRSTGPRNPARDLLRFQYERLERAARAWASSRTSRAMRTLHYRVCWRLAMGLGIDHLTENGFSFDPLIGVPYITGSSVKGLCRCAAAISRPEEEIERLFGPERTISAAPASRGAKKDKLIFLDAYPRRWPRLAVDIVNCHHANYYRSQGTTLPYPPGETESPVPVFFLTVDGDSEFTFRIGGQESDLDDAEELLTQGLEWLGLGAKTAVGYGTMEPSSPPTPR